MRFIQPFSVLLLLSSIIFVKAANLGESCDENTNNKCINTVQEKCINSTCQCDPEKGFVPNSYQNPTGCYPIANINETCSFHPQCNGNASLGNATCTDGRCRCKSDYVYADDRGTCLEVAFLDYQCDSTVQCKTGAEESHCQNNKCVCNVGAVPYLGFLCKRKQNLGGKCVDFGECAASINNSRCDKDTDTCVCTYGYVPSGGKCYYPAWYLGDSCQVLEQCAHKIINSICNSTGKCACKANYARISSDECLEEKSLGQSCEKSGQCVKGNLVNAKCFDDTCKCDTFHVENENNCWKELNIGSSCGNNTQCTISIKGEVECNSSSNTCQCKSGYKERKNFNECVENGAFSNVLDNTFTFIVLAITSIIFNTSL